MTSRCLVLSQPQAREPHKKAGRGGEGTPQLFYSVVPPTPSLSLSRSLSRSLSPVPLWCQSSEDASSFPHRSPDTPGGPRALSLSGRDTLCQPANLHQSPVDDLHLPEVGILCVFVFMCVCVCFCLVYELCERVTLYLCVCVSLSVWNWDYLFGRYICGCGKWRPGQPHIFTPGIFFEALLLTESQIWVLIKQTSQLPFRHPVAERRSRGLWNRKCTIKSKVGQDKLD